ncbi:hypothetical protein ACHAPT_008379 [Fusarium lateritium]
MSSDAKTTVFTHKISTLLIPDPNKFKDALEALYGKEKFTLSLSADEITVTTPTGTPTDLKEKLQYDGVLELEPYYGLQLKIVKK